jgi:hypothetical protein
MRYSLLFLLVFAACLLSCDPARRIEMKNSSSDTALVIWRVKKDSIGFNAFNLSNNRELKFTLPPKKNSEIKMSFGIGVWSPEEVEKLIHRLESFEIKTPHQNFKIDSLAQLRSYLLARRKGSSKIKIEIMPFQNR